MTLTFRKATEKDLKRIITLLFEDDLGQTREAIENDSFSKYQKAFEEINRDPNQYLLLALMNQEVIATCHLTFIPSLTFCGSTRMQIEAVRVDQKFRGQKIGEQMILKALEIAKQKEASIIQLTSNKTREEALSFYEKLGFKPTHIGFKMYM